MFSVFRLDQYDLLAYDTRDYVKERNLEAYRILFEEKMTEFETTLSIGLAECAEEEQQPAKRKDGDASVDEILDSISLSKFVDEPDSTGPVDHADEHHSCLTEICGDLPNAVACRRDSMKLETSYSYLSDRFHPCLELTSILCRLRKLFLGDLYEHRGDCDTNIRLLKELIQQEKDDNELAVLFGQMLQFPFIEITQGQGIITALRQKFGCRHVEDLYRALRHNPYNRSVMRKFRELQDPMDSGNELGWHLVKTGMVFSVPPAKPICRRYLDLSSRDKIHMLLGFGRCLDKLKVIKVDEKVVQRHTWMSDHEAIFDKTRSLELDSNKPTAFITPDCIVLCSTSRIDTNSVKIVASSSWNTRIEIEEFKQLVSGQDWEGLVLGYHLDFVTEACVNEDDEPVTIKPWEESSHVLDIPKLSMTGASPIVQNLIFRSQWYKSHPQCQSTRLEKHQIVTFCSNK